MGKSLAPHFHDGSGVRHIIIHVIIALAPLMVASVIFFGPRALLLMAFTITVVVLAEAVTLLIFRRDLSNLKDLSAVVTGIILSLSMPANLPFWIAFLAAGAAIGAKQLSRKVLGFTLLNPVLIGRGAMIVFNPYFEYPMALAWINTPDAIASATPLELLAGGYSLPGFGDLFLGLHAGVMGEVSILLILLGGAYLVWKRVICPIAPCVFIILTVALLAIMGQPPIVHLLSGSLVFAAVFMATDYSTTPFTAKGKIVFAVGIAVITAGFRMFGWLTEGVTFALITMNLFVPFIDKFVVRFENR